MIDVPLTKGANMGKHLGGGAATIRQYLRAKLIDELHVAIAPVLLGSGEPFWNGLDFTKLGLRVTQSVGTDNATHVVLTLGKT